MRKFYKVLIIITLIINMYSIIYRIQAADIWTMGKKWIETGKAEEEIQTFKQLESNTKIEFQKLIDFLWGLGLLAVFITTVVLGIKMMMVLPSEKSRVKQSMTPYIVGVVIIFGALTIWKTLIEILDGNL